MADGEGDLRPSAPAIWLDKDQENKFNLACTWGAGLERTELSEGVRGAPDATSVLWQS